jgi:hypothetical protein
MDERVEKLADSKFDGRLQKKRSGCYLTGKLRFKNAVAALLNDDDLARQVISIKVNRSEGIATIFSRRTPNGHLRSSDFGHPREVSHIDVTASINGSTLGSIGRILRAAQPPLFAPDTLKSKEQAREEGRK